MNIRCVVLEARKLKKSWLVLYDVRLEFDDLFSSLAGGYTRRM